MNALAAAQTPAPAETLQGYRPELSTPAALTRAVELAFDYRGDVTLELTSGANLIGYIFNRDAQATRPYLQVFPKDGTARQIVYYDEVVGLEFSGPDTAAGRTWQTWLAKVADARARGEIAELYPDEID